MDNNLHHTFLMFDDVHTWAGLLFNTNRAALADNLPDQQEKKISYSALEASHINKYLKRL